VIGEGRLIEGEAEKRQGCDAKTFADELSHGEQFFPLRKRKQGELVVQFVSRLGAGLGGDDCGSNYHSYKRQSNQEVMH
jgi:hypothetical protein